LLTCVHVLQGKVFEQPRNNRAWPPDAAFNKRQARKVTVDTNIKVLPFDKPNAADDWVLLQIHDEQAAVAAPAVRKWSSEALSGNFRIYGYAGGEDSFPQDKVLPTRTTDLFAFRDISHGESCFTGHGTRPGISGGGVFGEANMQFAGLHRSRFDTTLQVRAVSSFHILSQLYELGYETVSHSPDTFIGQPLLEHLKLPTTININGIAQALEPALASVIWSRLRQGEHGFLSAKLYHESGQILFEDVKRRLRIDAMLAESVYAYIADCEAVLEQLGMTSRQEQNNFIASKIGRVYLFLAHATERIT
jgi:hypothetical protein